MIFLHMLIGQYILPKAITILIWPVWYLGTGIGKIETVLFNFRMKQTYLADKIFNYQYRNNFALAYSITKIHRWRLYEISGTTVGPPIMDVRYGKPPKACFTHRHLLNRIHLYRTKCPL